MSDLLAGRVAIVSGAARGIGPATVQRLSGEGARVLMAVLTVSGGALGGMTA